MASAVLDASAALALLNDEHGANEVRSYIPGVVMSAVNVAEVVTKLADRGMDENEVRVAFATLGAEVVGCDENRAVAIGMLRPGTRDKGLSLGDRACLALAREQELPVVTADRAWKDLALGIDVRLIRNLRTDDDADG